MSILNIKGIEKMKYTSQYVEKINNGEIVIGKKIKKALNRLNHYLSEYEFIQEKVDKKIYFIENETSQTKGSSDKLILALPQKCWLEIAWGFYYDEELEMIDPQTFEPLVQIVKHRVIHEVPLVVGRGNGKTTLASGIALAGQLVDGEEGADVQLLAYRREQSTYIYNAVRAMISRKGTVLHKMNKKDVLKSTKQGIMHVPTNSLMSIKTADYESLDGTNAHYNVFDEVHTYDNDFIKVVNDGSSKKRLDWMTWYLTTNGTKRDAVFDKYYKKWTAILYNDIQDDSIFPLIYEIDSVDDVSQLEKYPEKTKNFQKANPMIGIMPSLTVKSILRDIDSNRGDMFAQNEILAKTFNFPTEAFGAYFSNEEITGNAHLYNEKAFQGSSSSKINVVIGADLAEVNDICSISLMTVDYGETFYFKTFSFLPRRSLEKLPDKKKDFMNEQIKNGNLIVHDNDYNDIKDIFNRVRQFMTENHIRPVVLAYDEWHSKELINEYKSYYDIKTAKPIRQTVKSLSVPLKMYKTLLSSQKIIYDNTLTKWAHSNVQVKQDANGNIYPNKSKATDKIDPFMAQLDAYAGYLASQDLVEMYQKKRQL